MSLSELAAILSQMYNSAPHGEWAASTHLFGIKYAEQIEASGAKAHDIAKAAGIPESYGTEINKGMKLAKYVQLR